MTLTQRLRDLDDRFARGSPHDASRSGLVLLALLPCLLAAVVLGLMGYTAAAVALTVVPPVAAAAVLGISSNRTR